VRYQIRHQTVYHYENPVSVSHHVVRLTPRSLARQKVLETGFNILPSPAALDSHEDYFGNLTTFLTVEGPHAQLTVSAASRVEVEPAVNPDPAATAPWEKIRDFSQGSAHSPAWAVSEFVYSSPLIATQAVFEDYARPCFGSGRPLLEAAIDLMHSLHKDFTFDPKATTVATPLPQVFRQRRGVCQDFAQLQIACLRSLGLPARYVSGYLETTPPPGKPRLVGADASHAWLQVWCGDAGWIDLDPTNDLLPSHRHVTVAWGRDFGDVSPLRGVLVGSGKHRLEVAVDVIPVDEPAPSQAPS
jgi:transglutaminase-like putative cysteine protease